MIVIPQALRIALPTLINEFITCVKLTSLISVISLSELLLVGQRLYSQNFLVMETLSAIAIYYVLIVTVFGWLLQYVERRLDLSKRKPETLAAEQIAALRTRLVRCCFAVEPSVEVTVHRAHRACPMHLPYSTSGPLTGTHEQTVDCPS